MFSSAQTFGSGLGGLLGGLFGDSGAPYEKAMEEYEKWGNRARDVQNPFYNAGTGAIPQFQDFLNRMKDPTSFINNIMGKYQESPFAKFQQQQATRSAQNLGSATGLTGSTPLTQFAEENARNISSQDMQNFLSRVLGVNTEYGQGVSSLIGRGQESANSLTNLFSRLAELMGDASYGKEAGNQSDFWNTIGGAGQILASFLM